MRYKQIVVIGSHEAALHLDEAFEIGRFIAKNKWVLITGGRGGIMEAVSRGAESQNGLVIGIIPAAELDMANPYCSVVIPSGIGYARNMTNVLSGDVVIAMGGESGTLSELAYAWQFNKPIICCMFAGGITQKFAGMTLEEGRANLQANIHQAYKVEDVFTILNSILK